MSGLLLFRYLSNLFNTRQRQSVRGMSKNITVSHVSNLMSRVPE